MKLICLISHPRSGSTSLMKKIQQESNTSAVLEIFHPNEDVINQHLDEGLGKGGSHRVKEKLSIENIRDFAVEYPVKYIEAIRSVSAENNQEAVIFKIFPGHIKNVEKLAEVISLCDSLFFLRRNTLHSYISNKKAIKVGTYANVNTSQIKVDFNGKEFLSWRESIYSFFNTVEKLLNHDKIEVLYCNYEELYSKDERFINTMYSKMRISVVNVEKSVPALRKQDNSPYAHEKISNPDDLLGFLYEYKLQELDPVSNVDIFN